MVTAYFRRLDDSRFRPSDSVQGAWNTDEQHIAPALGLLTHVIERDRDSRRDDDLRLTRLAFDILGTLPIDTVEVQTRVIRPGRTIELVEATLEHDGRTAVILRAWLQRPADTSAITGSDFPGVPALEELPAWEGSQLWPGEFVRTVDARRQEIAPGRARFWLRPRVPLIEDEPVSASARALSILDVANGITPRLPPGSAAFPNLDTTVHLFRQPTGDWIGYDTTVSFGPDGVGLTHTVLHDRRGPIGTANQTLTIRPR